MISKLRVGGLAVLLAARLLAAEASSPSLRAILSPTEFSGAGLDKLSPAELTKLETALAAHRDALASPAAKPNAKAARSEKTAPAAREFGAEQVAARTTVDTAAELKSRVEGTVTDITGRSVFVLENGQVWQQRIPDKIYVPRPLQNPPVTITRGIAGYRMDIDGVDRTLFVKRIQ